MAERDVRTGASQGALHYGHPSMPLAERAKIFAPFDPLKGFREELARREEEARLAHEQVWGSGDDESGVTGEL